MTPVVEELLRRIAEACEKSAAILERMEKRSSAKDPKPVATDQELDDPKWGDPEVRKDPPRWKGSPQAPCHMNECPPDYLECLADFFDWQAGKAEEKNECTDKGKPIAPYRRADAAKARGWAKRNRSGRKPAPKPATDPGW